MPQNIFKNELISEITKCGSKETHPIYDVRYLYLHKVIILGASKPIGVVQHNCQEIGHTKSHYALAPVGVCGELHKSSKCQKPTRITQQKSAITFKSIIEPFIEDVRPTIIL